MASSNCCVTVNVTGAVRGRVVLGAILPLVLLALIHPIHGSHEEPGSSRELMDCINQNQEGENVTNWQNAMTLQPARLHAVGVWWSNKNATVPLTITTQMSVARLWQLRALCMSYPGPVSVVLYVAVPQARLESDAKVLPQFIEQTGEFFQLMEHHAQCKLDMLLVLEVVLDKLAKIWYPVNQLRNYARLQARTPFIAVVDADLLISPGLVRQLEQQPRPAQLQNTLDDMQQNKY